VNRPKDQNQSHRLHFVTSAVNMQGCPEDEQPEVAIVGRSNAGKSTLINGLAQSRIAMVSGTPGKTRLLNFYEKSHPTNGYRIVDMPGYGFSSRSGDEQRSWQSMIEPYLATRGNLVGLLIVMDIRREWSKDEQDLLNWMRPRALPSAVVLTKADKLTRSAILQRLKLIKQQSGIDAVLATSSLQKSGFTDVEDFFFEQWVKPAQERKKW
jgi:GTP-binding protein